MKEQTPSVSDLIGALLIGSTVGGVGFTVAMADSLANFVSHLSILNVFGFGILGAILGTPPFILIALPACLALESRRTSALTKISVLGVGGMAVGAAIGVLFGFSGLWIWPTMVGGCTGFTLGLLRRNAPAS